MRKCGSANYRLMGAVLLFFILGRCGSTDLPFNLLKTEKRSVVK
jgi:hypothetical protein